MLQTIIRTAISLRWIDYNPFAGFKDKFRTVDQLYLENEELIKILLLNTGIERVDIVKDLFLFCCFTGLAYADLKKLPKEHITYSINGGRWIQLHRTKSKMLCKVPLLPQALTILKKYEQHLGALQRGKALPVPANQNFNAYLKEIGSFAGISKNLTCYVARRTFASIAINLGIPAEIIVKVIGHSTFKNLHLYAKLDDPVYVI